MELYDCVVIGGGPAGLSAAIYLARFLRKVIVVDAGNGRTFSHEHNDNYFGFPKGIQSKELTKRGIEQALRFGVIMKNDRVLDIVRKDNIFNIAAEKEQFFTRSIIFATGVKDVFPKFENSADYLGRSLFWCITCDGYKTRGKKVVVVGEDDEAATTALQFLNYTKNVELITCKLEGQDDFSKKGLEKLKRYNIPIYHDVIKAVHGEKGMMKEVELYNGTIVRTDFMFNLQPAIPNSDLAKLLKVEINRFGYIETDENQRTVIPFVYAAGDVTRAFAHQIITAAHEGSMAAQACNYDLYNPDQRD